MGQTTLEKLPLPVEGSQPPSNTWFLGPKQVSKPNNISIGSAAFAGLTHVPNRQTTTRDIAAHAMQPNKKN